MGLHHTHSPICPLCEDKKKDLHEVMVFWFNYIKRSHPEAHISWAFRGEHDQNMEFMNAKSKLKWPNSFHNKHKISNGKVVPESQAFDLFKLRKDMVAQWPVEWFEGINLELKEVGAPLDWGGDLWSWDTNHFQMRKEAVLIGPNLPPPQRKLIK